ncbi:hypothetical protein A176_004608 [Myxococcus hansupus]|uniref:Uncharacterized protein n=1 Tax=Pseudomyxococcus hansupus TaxID=1297742 RepID=A0A0H4WWC4_9BACT|nr:hypothetical protein A176_004608 [Myxococcus hansupus]
MASHLQGAPLPARRVQATNHRPESERAFQQGGQQALSASTTAPRFSPTEAVAASAHSQHVTGETP